LGSPSRNTGSDEAVCTSAMSVGELVSVVITHAAATSFIHIETFEPTHTSQRLRNVRSPSGAHTESPSGGGGPGGCSDGAGVGSCSAMRGPDERNRRYSIPRPRRGRVSPVRH